MPTPDEILSFSENFSLYFTFTIFAIGGMGNLINIGVLSTLKLFRSNQCAFYLIVESIVDTCQLAILFIMYLLPNVLGYDPGSTSLAWCKLKSMLPQILRLLSTSMVCFAAVDQFLSTNPRLVIRQISSLKLARRLLVAGIIIWTLHSVPYGVFYQLIPPAGCVINSPALVRYYSFFYYPVLHGLLPIFVASLFALLAYRNVRRLVRRGAAVERRRLDRQLTAMIFIRVIFFVLSLLPYTIYRIYALNVTVNRANLHAYAMDRLLFSMMSSVTNLNYTVSFYIFLATSARYRRQVKHFLVKKCWQSFKNFCGAKPNEIRPSAPISAVVVTDLE